MFTADFHAVLDRIEEPDVLLKQAVREMEEDLTRDKRRINELKNEHAQLEHLQSDIEQSLNKISEELDVCFGSNNENLAKGLIKRRLETQNSQEILIRKIESLGKTIDELNARLKENQENYESMRQKSELFASSDKPSNDENYSIFSNNSVRDEDVEVAFLREKQKRRQS
jgi:phage shock protein A